MIMAGGYPGCLSDLIGCKKKPSMKIEGFLFYIY